MPGGRSSIIVGFGLGFSLIAVTMTPASAGGGTHLSNAQVEPLAFAALEGWKDDDHVAAFEAYLKSCGAILQGDKAMRKARPFFGGLFNACEKAVALGTPEREQARKFFEDNFKPVRIAPHGQTDGFFTGYYETEVEGSPIPTDEFKVPLYAAPEAAVKKKQSKVFANFSRTDIEDGALEGKKLEICWVKNPIDAFFAQIQGSTRVKLDGGKLMRLNYIASNGQPYYPVGKWLIDKGIISKEEMTMDKIRDWMEANPEEGKELRRKNRSFVFFQEINLAENDECIGAQGIPLTPGRSLAVDKNIHIYGTPVWIDAEFPIASEKPETKFRRLMFAQDTGSAIVGPARADIYWGHGEEISHIAGRVKHFGKFVMLVPQDVAVTGSPPPANNDIPLPRPRPIDINADATPTSSIPAAAVPTSSIGATPLPKPRP
jgi:membrane-bound lytic murein transglycosylase A